MCVCALVVFFLNSSPAIWAVAVAAAASLLDMVDRSCHVRHVCCAVLLCTVYSRRERPCTCERNDYNEHIIAETTIYVHDALINRHPNGMEHEYARKYQVNACASRVALL